MLVSVGKAEQASVTRVDRFQGPMTSGQTLHVENYRIVGVTVDGRPALNGEVLETKEAKALPASD